MFKENLCFFLFSVAAVVSGFADNSHDSATVSQLAIDYAARNQGIVLGLEIVQTLNDKVIGEKEIKKAKESIGELAKIAEEQTDYEVVYHVNNILVRPKINSAKNNSPLSIRMVDFSWDGVLPAELPDIVKKNCICGWKWIFGFHAYIEF